MIAGRAPAISGSVDGGWVRSVAVEVRQAVGEHVDEEDAEHEEADAEREEERQLEQAALELGAHS